MQNVPPPPWIGSVNHTLLIQVLDSSRPDYSSHASDTITPLKLPGLQTQERRNKDAANIGVFHERGYYALTDEILALRSESMNTFPDSWGFTMKIRAACPENARYICRRHP